MAIFLPRLPIDRLRRAARRARASGPEGEARSGAAPLVVVRTRANAPRLVALDVAAERLGLYEGLALADARARVPHLVVEEEDEGADDALMAALASWATCWTPFVAVAGPMEAPRDLALDITGCAHLFGGEAALLEEVVARLGAMGFGAQGAVASTLRAARALARWQPGARPAAGQERAATGPLPIAALELEEAVARRLSGLGLLTLEDVWAQPRAALAARFGAGLVTRLDEMAGLVDTPISPARPVPLHMAERRFAEPMADLETARKVLLDLARDLCALLERQGQGARRLEASFFRSDGAVRHVTAATARPVRDPLLLAGLFRERLAALADPLDPGFGFDVLRLSLLAGEPWEAHQEAFDAPPAEDVSALVDRLSARLGAHRVMCFAAGDTHLPEGAAQARPALRGETSPGGMGPPDARAGRSGARASGAGHLGTEHLGAAGLREDGPGPWEPGPGRLGGGGPAPGPLGPGPSGPESLGPGLLGPRLLGSERLGPEGLGPERLGPGAPELKNQGPEGAGQGILEQGKLGPGSLEQGDLEQRKPGQGRLEQGHLGQGSLGAEGQGPEPPAPKSRGPGASTRHRAGKRSAGAPAPRPLWPEPLAPALPAARPLTLFPRPEPVEALAEVPDGPPLRFRWRRALHEVARAEGPERIAPEWWRGEEAFTRDYFRVEDKEGRRFWLYREGTYGRETARPRWFLHGLFA